MFTHDTILSLYAQARRDDDLAPRRARRASRPTGARWTWRARLLPYPRLNQPSPRPVATTR